MDELKRILYRELYKKSFYEFVKAFWKYADPSPLIDGKIVKLFCEIFQYMCRSWIGYTPVQVDLPKDLKEDDVLFDIRSYGDKNHININVPPRHSKSMIFNVLGACWLWTNYPVKVASISHTRDLAKKMNEKRQKVINSPLYKELFGINLVANTTEFLKDDRGGELYSLNRDSMTGYGADIIINDDLTNTETARKDKEEMNNAWSYFRNTMPSRINDLKHSVIMNIQQRIAPNDITGRMLSEKALRDLYIHLVIPSEFEHDTYFVCPISAEVISWKKGEYLWQERFGDYKGLRIEVGSSNYETQYLQRSMASENTIIKQDMIKERSILEVPSLEDADIVFASHDFPVKDKETSDNLGSVVAYKKDGNLYIIDALEKKMAFVKSIEYVRRIDEIYAGIVQIIEDKANGTPILEQLQEEISGLQAFNPSTASKMQRLESASLYMGNVIFVKTEKNPVLNDYELSNELIHLKNRLLSFPYVDHDDIVDAFSMLLLFVFKDRKYQVYGRSFNSDNIIVDISQYENIYSNIFFNREGDIWKVLEIGVDYGEHSKLIIKRELKFKSNIENAFKKIKEFAGNKRLLIDCSSQTGLYGTNENGLYIERYEISDLDRSITDLNLAFDKNLVLIQKECVQTKLDIESFKFSKSKDETAKYLTDKDGFVSCIRLAMQYYGGIK